ncbi:MAG: hypothetical protein M3X11_18910, partial [Acidobacteriota bacterium]|nr:hypothetical protein [Acidobacteriota bacterium]
AWLDAGGELALVKDFILQWFPHQQQFLLPEAQFVYKAWLDASGELAQVKDFILQWLPHQQQFLLPEADFVYRAWLVAGGDPLVIEAHLLAWLGVHGEREDVDFVFRAWLKRRFPFSMIREPALRWFDKNYLREEAGFLLKELVRQADLPAETVRQALAWCRQFPANEDVWWRLTGLRTNLLRPEIADELSDTAELLIGWAMQRLDHRATTTILQINAVFSYLSKAPGFRKGSLRQRSDALLLTWLRHPLAFEFGPRDTYFLQRMQYFQRVTDLLVFAPDILHAERAHLARFLRWVNRWEPDRKDDLRPLIATLRIKYPDQELWDIVKFD